MWFKVIKLSLPNYTFSLFQNKNRLLGRPGLWKKYPHLLHLCAEVEAEVRRYFSRILVMLGQN